VTVVVVVMIVAVMTVSMSAIIVILIAAVVAVVIFIPPVIMLYAAVTSVPITAIEAFAVMARSDPACALVRGPGPIAFVPAITATGGIPVTANPDEVRSGLLGNHRDHPWRGWRKNSDANRDLSAGGVRAGEQECEEQAASE